MTGSQVPCPSKYNSGITLLRTLGTYSQAGYDLFRVLLQFSNCRRQVVRAFLPKDTSDAPGRPMLAAHVGGDRKCGFP